MRDAIEASAALQDNCQFAFVIPLLLTIYDNTQDCIDELETKADTGPATTTAAAVERAEWSEGHMQQSHDALHGAAGAAVTVDDNINKAAASQAHDDSLIEAPEELPFNAPLSHELFLSKSYLTPTADFDASAFLLTRKHMSLDDLRSELRSYLANLRSQLVSIINSDYEDFINLGGSHLLGSEDQMSLRMRKPLEGISREIMECKHNLEDMRNALRIKLKKRELVRERKLVCRKLLGVNDQVIKVEEMLLIPSPPSLSTATSSGMQYSNSASGEGPDGNSLMPGNALVARNTARRVSPSMAKKVDRSMGSDTKRLERIAQEYNQLLYLVRKSQGLTFVESLQPRIDRISNTLQQDLSSLLSSTLTSLHTSSSSSVPSSNSNTSLTSSRQVNQLNDYKAKLESLTDLFRTYASIGKYREAEEVVRKLLVTDFMSKTIHREALLGPQSPLMPITPFGGASGSTPSASSAMFGSLGQAFSQASPSVNAPSTSSSAYPFPTPQSNSAFTPNQATLSNEDRSLIPAFYVMEPVSPPPAAADSDTYISDALVELYNKILVFVSKELGYILEITERRPSQGRSGTAVGSNNDNNMASSGFLERDAGDRTIPSSPSTRERGLYGTAQSSSKAGYEMLSNVVWNEIAKRLMNECGHLIFAAGRPDSFHRNYLTTLSFIERLESICPNTRYLQVLRNNSEYIAFMKRWQLPVYFQLRFREIIGHLENSLAAHTIAPAPSAVQSTSLTMAATEQIYKAMSICWSDDVYLSDLSSRLWRLTLQILSRYKTWLDAHLPDYVVKDAAASIAATSNTSNTSSATSAPGLNLQRLIPSNPLLSSRPATPQPQGNTSSDDNTDETTLRQLSIVISDVSKLENMTHQLFEKTVNPKLPKLAPGSMLAVEEGEDTPEAALNTTLETLTSIIPSLLAQLATILSKRCSEPLRLVRSGASQVRANASKGNGKAPEPSYFVPNILRPAKVFLDGHGKVLQESMKRDIMQTLFEDLANRYEAALSKMKKDGDALKRLKKGRQGFQLFGRSTASSTAANEEAASAEDEKVRLQMSADIEAFAKDAESLGVVLGDSEALKALRTVVQDWNK